MNKITSSRDYIGKVVAVEIDRALNSAHPKYGWKYEANYGFVPGTMSPDGEELDAYVLGVTEPLKTSQGKCIAVIHRLNDDDDKLVIVPEEAAELSNEQIEKLTHFQEQFFKSEIWR